MTHRRRTPQEPGISYRRIWITVALNIALLLVLIYFVLKLACQANYPAFDLVRFEGGFATVAGTSAPVPVAKEVGAVRVLFVGELPNLTDGSVRPLSMLMVFAAQRLPGRTLDFQELRSPTLSLADLARLLPLCPRFEPDLVVIVPSAQAQPSPDEGTTDEKEFREGIEAIVNQEIRVGLIAAPGAHALPASAVKTLAPDESAFFDASASTATGNENAQALADWIVMRLNSPKIPLELAV